MFIIGEEQFVNQWGKVCRLSGARVEEELSVSVDFVIAAASVDESDKTLLQASKFNIPCLSVEYICQCLINQQILDHSIHPYFHYTYVRTE